MSARFGLAVVDVFGSTEGAIALDRSGDPPRGSVGRRREGVKIVDTDGNEMAPARFDAPRRLDNAEECVGEIAPPRAVSPFEGYYRNEEAMAKATRFGWYWSGDLAYADGDGWVYFAGRTSDWIRVDGENFPAAPIDTILARHPDVMLVSAYGVPDVDSGDRVMASLVLHGGRRFEPVAFATWLDDRSEMSPKWQPTYVRVCEALPTTPTNKVLTRTLVHEKFRSDRTGGDTVYVRRRGDAAYRVFDADEELRPRSLGEPVLNAWGGAGRPWAPGGPVAHGGRVALRGRSTRVARGQRRQRLDRLPAPGMVRTGPAGGAAAGRRWQARLAAARWVGINWPADFGGRGASPVEVAIFNAEYARSGAPQLVNRVGINLAGPTLLAHGSPEQCRRWLPAIAKADEIWCQLFSEPGAGSDLSSLTTRAEAVDDGWLVSGQKVWTSYAQFARWGLCLARSEPGSQGGRGLSLLVVDMTSPGIEIRPARADDRGGGVQRGVPRRRSCPGRPGCGRGWPAGAGTTLAHERGTNFPFKEEVVHEGYLSRLFEAAAANGSLDDPGCRRR